MKKNISIIVYAAIAVGCLNSSLVASGSKNLESLGLIRYVREKINKDSIFSCSSKALKTTYIWGFGLPVSLLLLSNSFEKSSLGKSVNKSNTKFIFANILSWASIWIAYKKVKRYLEVKALEKKEYARIHKAVKDISSIEKQMKKKNRRMPNVSRKTKKLEKR